jgi:predicted amidohydrolase
MKAQLVAVQARMQPADYHDAASFRAKILALTERAVDGLGERPRLLAFPELIGFPLLMLDEPEALRAGSVARAIRLLLQEHRLELLGVMAGRQLGLLGALYALRAVPAYLAYREAFAEAARLAGATVVAGSILLPHVEEEAARGVHVVGRRVYNTAFSFGPHGGVLNRTRKCYLMPNETRSGLSRGIIEQLSGFETPLGQVGVAVCLDGFYSSVIERFDGLGAAVVVQPSANPAEWTRRWPPNPVLSEGEAWLSLGLRQQLQGRLHLRYGVNPMLVGDLLGLSLRGRSSLVVNTRFQPDVGLEGYQGLLAIAPSDREEAFVRAEIALG